MLRGASVQLHFGENEVFAPAKVLKSGRKANVSQVEYWHLMFDSHQAVLSEGLETESFYPGDMAMASLDKAASHEVEMLFPELRLNTNGYGPVCRPCLKAHEAPMVYS